jgi:uncharacterized protein (DUF1684 family)
MEQQAGRDRENAGQESEPTWLDLYDYRERVANMYRERDRALRAGDDAQRTLERFRSAKDALFVAHPQSPLSAAQRGRFTGLRYFPYDSHMRVEALLVPEPPSDEVISAADGPHTLQMKRAARLEFEMGGAPLRLVVYWIDVYGGGLFLPFRDATCPDESYGGGRYLFDTAKGSDFLKVGEAGAGIRGYAGGRVLLDFNYAYNPSCAYDSRWVCPLAPRENRLPVRVQAGEMNY